MTRILAPRMFSPFLAALLLLAAILAFLFSGSFRPNQVVFSNDGPLGVLQSESMKMPDSLRGYWADLHWLGLNGRHAPASITYAVLGLLGPVGFAKFYPAITLLILGLCAWAFFRSLGLKPAWSTVAVIGAALNSNYLSNTAWGLGTRSLALGCVFLALAALSARRAGNPWLNAALGGLATGMAVVEGADNGVILSLFLGMFVVWQSFVDGASIKAGALKGLRLVLVVLFAVFIATQSLITLFDIASKGAVSAQADTETKEQKWAFATQWSLPPAETMRVLIPGLYGYRMDSPSGGNYWGRVAETPGYPGSRSSGAGEYAGVLVVLIGLWAMIYSFVRNGNVFSPGERKMIWFWMVSLAVAIVLSWGRYAPFFYKIVYSLPYFSSIRNPMKFMHAAHLALMILFAYGLLGMNRKYFEAASAPGGRARSGSPAVTFDRWWTIGMFGAVALSLLGFMVYSSARGSLAKHLMNAGFGYEPLANEIAGFSVAEVGKFVLFFAVSATAVWLVMRGTFAGKSAIRAAVMLGVILTVDLVRASTPWIIYWDYRDKYATNPIIDSLRAKPHEARVASPSFLFDSRAAAPAGQYTAAFPDVYGIEWVQHHFQYYNIQSVDVAQDPRPPADKRGYLAAFGQGPLGFDPAKYISLIGRYWELSNTRYLLGMTGFIEALNTQVDKGRNRFRVVETFNIAPKPSFRPGLYRPKPEELTAVSVTNGPLALFEFTGALPRAKLFANWQVVTNGDETMKTLTNPTFDPSSMVLVSDNIPPAAAVSTNASGGRVEISSYSPRRLVLKADATAPSILLLNDRYDQDWQVTVDGQVAKLLRANFIMRGVQVPGGQHMVVFEFRPSLTGLKISLAAIGIGVVMCGFVWWNGRRQNAAPAS